MSGEYDATIEVIESVVKACGVLLHGHGPTIQSAALAELVCLWLAGHPDFVRAEVYRAFDGLIHDMLPSVEGELYRGNCHPQNIGLKNAGLAS